MIDLSGFDDLPNNNTKDINERINKLDWVAREEYGWRMYLKALRQYRKELEESKLPDRIPHLDLYIEEVERERKR